MRDGLMTLFDRIILFFHEGGLPRLLKVIGVIIFLVMVYFFSMRLTGTGFGKGEIKPVDFYDHDLLVAFEELQEMKDYDPKKEYFTEHDKYILHSYQLVGDTLYTVNDPTKESKRVHRVTMLVDKVYSLPESYDKDYTELEFDKKEEPQVVHMYYDNEKKLSEVIIGDEQVYLEQ